MVNFNLKNQVSKRPEMQLCMVDASPLLIRRSPRLNNPIKIPHDFCIPKVLAKRPNDERDFSHSSTSIKLRKLVEESTEKEHDIKKVWHGNQCPSCVALSSIKEEIMACLQHHYKHCACYSIFYRVMAFLETLVEVPGGFEKESHFLNHNQAKQLCETASSKQKGKASSLLLKRAAELSDQLLGPVETAAFNCDHYEEYMKLLLDIAEKCLKNEDKIRILIEDIKNHLKPFSRNQKNDEITGHRQTAKDSQPEVKKWNETYLALSHSSGDEEFGKNLKDIVEPKRGRKCFFFPEKYDFLCHGQSAGTSSNPINDGRENQSFLHT